MSDRAREVAPGVHRLGSAFVNWYLIEDDDGVTLVDAGLPGQWRQLLTAMPQLNRRLRDVRAVVLTHGDAGHAGFAQRTAERTGARVRVHAADATEGTRKFLPMQLFTQPTSWAFLAHSLREGLMSTPPVAQLETFVDGVTLDVPGRPVVRHTPGHTAGSCVLHLPDRGVVFTGDALVTLDPFTGGRGPRILTDSANTDPRRTRASLELIAAIDAQLVLPGHGDPWATGTGAAVAHARERASTTAAPSG